MENLEVFARAIIKHMGFSLGKNASIDCIDPETWKISINIDHLPEPWKIHNTLSQVGYKCLSITHIRTSNCFQLEILPLEWTKGT